MARKTQPAPEPIDTAAAHNDTIAEAPPDKRARRGVVNGTHVIVTPTGLVLPLLEMTRFDKRSGRNSVSYYMQVAQRLVWMRDEHPDWSIQTAIVERTDDWALARATILDEHDRVLATAIKQEDTKGFSEFLEKAETGAVGRALALCGYGSQFAPELDEGERIVDSPVPPPPSAAPATASPKPTTPTQPAAGTKAASQAALQKQMNEQAPLVLVSEVISECVRTGTLRGTDDDGNAGNFLMVNGDLAAALNAPTGLYEIDAMTMRQALRVREALKRLPAIAPPRASSSSDDEELPF